MYTSIFYVKSSIQFTKNLLVFYIRYSLLVLAFLTLGRSTVGFPNMNKFFDCKGGLFPVYHQSLTILVLLRLLTIRLLLYFQERATEKRMDVNSFPNWAWQLQGLNGGATPMPLFSAAASSGFPSSTATSPPAAVTQLHFPNTTILHHHFSPSTVTNNIPGFYCRSWKPEPDRI